MDKSDWKVYKFGQIAKSIGERVEPTKTDLEIYVGLEHIDSDSIHIKRFGKRDDVSGTKLRCYPGDVIFGRRRAYQRKAAIVAFDGFCSAHSLVLRANPDVINPKLFPFFLHSDAFMNRAVDISVGSLSPTINWGTLKTEEFPLPPSDQQTRLAELLWSADDVKEKSIDLFNVTEKLSHALVDDLQVIENCDEETKSFMALKDLVDLVNGRGFKTSEWKNNGYPIIRIQNLNGSKEFNYYSGEIDPRHVVHNGDLLFAWSGNLGTSFGPFIWWNETGVLNQHIFNVKLLRNDISIDLLYFYLKKITKLVEAHAHGTAGLVHITKERMNQMGIQILEEHEQQKILSKLKSAESIRVDAKEKMIATMQLQKSLINQIF